MTWTPPPALPAFFGLMGNRCSVDTETGDNLKATIRSCHRVWVTIPGTVQLCIGQGNWTCGANVSFTDTGTGHDLNATASLEYPLNTTLTAATWGGASNIAIPSGMTATALASFSAPTVGIYEIAIRRCLQSPLGVMPLKRAAHGGKRSLSYGDAVEITNTDKTLSGTVNDSGGDWMNYPLFIVSLTTGASVYLDGDSIQAGEGHTDDSKHRGIIAPRIGEIIAYSNHGVAQQGYREVAKSAKRLQAMIYHTHIVSEAGVNYRANGSAAMYTASQAQKADCSPRNYSQCTMIPKSTSPDFTDPTGANQTIDGFSTDLSNYNALVRADPNCIDNEAELRLSSDHRKWRVRASDGAALTAPGDGTHPNDAGYAELAAPITFTPGDYSFMPSVRPADLM